MSFSHMPAHPPESLVYYAKKEKKEEKQRSSRMQMCQQWGLARVVAKCIHPLVLPGHVTAAKTRMTKEQSEAQMEMPLEPQKANADEAGHRFNTEIFRAL